MKNEPLTEEVIRATLLAYSQAFGNQRAAARLLGIAKSTLQDRLTKAKKMGFSTERPPSNAPLDWAHRRLAKRGIIAAPPLPEIAVPPDGFVVTSNAGAYDAEGKLLRQWVKTKPDAGGIYDIPVGHVVKGESALVDPEGRVLARWIKTKEGAGEDLLEALREAFEDYSGAAPNINTPTHADSDTLTLYPLPDLHFGMYAWHRETGDDYDVPRAVQIATESITSLVTQSRSSKDAILLVLGDYFHANDQKGVTPAHQHRLDVDTRWSKVFRAGADLIVKLVDIIARKHENVEVVFLPGNHDPDASMCLAVAIGMFFANTPRINVSDEPGIAWYRRFGKVLLGATHGHTVKSPERMAMMLASDRAKDWGETTYRHFYSGHIHHTESKEVGPVQWESFSSPAGRDAYNAAAGFRSGRALSAITFHKERGEIGRHRVNILPVEVK